jgi:hypothetical protein
MPYKYSEKSKAQVWGSICNQYDWQDTLKMGAGFSFYKNAWRHENETWLAYQCRCVFFFHGFELRSYTHCMRISNSSKSSSVNLHSRVFFFIGAGFSCVTPASAAAKVRFYLRKLWCAFVALVTKSPK